MSIGQLTREQVEPFHRPADALVQSPHRAGSSAPVNIEQIHEALGLAIQGIDHFNQGSYKKVVEVVQRARRVFEDYGFDEQTALCLFCEGASLVNLSRWEEAIGRLTQAKEYQRLLGVDLFGDLLGYLGIALHNASRHEEAVETLQKVRALLQTPPEAATRVFPLGQLEAASLLALGRWAEAMVVYEQISLPPPGVSALERQTFYQDWTRGIVEMGVAAVREARPDTMESAANKLIALRDDPQKQAAGEVEKALQEALRWFAAQSDMAVRSAYEEFHLLVQLLSIKDPFERWRALGEAVSEDWPEGLSAVESIRRERE